MAILTLINQSFFETASARDTYLASEMAAGRTNGLGVQVYYPTAVNGSGQPLVLTQLTWTTNQAATDYIAFCNTLTPAPVYAQVITTTV